jgi:DNA mismatch repair ATPase MutS
MDMELNKKNPGHGPDIYKGEFEVKIPRQMSQKNLNSEEIEEYVREQEKSINETAKNRDKRPLNGTIMGYINANKQRKALYNLESPSRSSTPKYLRLGESSGPDQRSGKFGGSRDPSVFSKSNNV